jgi:arylsulfatase A-like enzyme
MSLPVYLCVLLLGVFACGGPAPAPDGDPLEELAALQKRDDINLIYILIDTLRADRLSAYGYARPTSPNLEILARRGIRFTHVQSQSSWTKCSMASLWMGAYPIRTGVLRFQHAVPETAGNFGFAQGFDAYFRPAPSRRDGQEEHYSPSAGRLQGTDLDATESAIEFLRTFGDQRFFLYIHYMDVHQYLYDEGSALFGTTYSDAYDNAIHWTDANIALLVNELIDRGLLERTLIVIGSDHGEAFLEHGEEGHARNVYSEVVEVPLIIVPPLSRPRGVVVEPLVQNVDIWPTLLDLLGLPELPDAQGESLVPLIRSVFGDEDVEIERFLERPAFAEIDQTWGRRKREPRPLVAVQEGRFRLIHQVKMPAADQLFDRESDPAEQTNLASARRDVVDALRTRVAAYRDEAILGPDGAEEVEIDELQLEQLRALGYLGRP